MHNSKSTFSKWTTPLQSKRGIDKEFIFLTMQASEYQPASWKVKLIYPDTLRYSRELGIQLKDFNSLHSWNLSFTNKKLVCPDQVSTQLQFFMFAINQNSIFVVTTTKLIWKAEKHAYSFTFYWHDQPNELWKINPEESNRLQYHLYERRFFVGTWKTGRI